VNEDEKESLWNQVKLALDARDEDRVITLAKELSEAGDSRGSYSLGYIFEVRAKRASLTMRVQKGDNYIDRENFIAAAHWYNRALSQGGGYGPHSGLAAYYYYGLGGKYDFKLAYEHLSYCLEYASAIQGGEDASLNIAKNKIMMGELHLLGLGTPKDMHVARKLFAAAAEIGYPAALIGLARVDRAERHFFRSMLYFFRSLRVAIKLVIKDKDHPLLAGIGGKRQTFWRK
jgi:Sel1 repeat